MSDVALENDKSIRTSKGHLYFLDDNYCTTYSVQNALRNEVQFKNLSKKQQTGHTKNVTPYVEYNKLIDDEKSDFSIKNPYESTYSKEYKKPSWTGLQQPSVLRESGFCRVPRSRRTVAEEPHYMVTTSKASFNASNHFYKSANFNLSSILNSESGFTSDVEHIVSLGSKKDNLSESKLLSEKKNIRIVKLLEDGYSRLPSVFPDKKKYVEKLSVHNVRSLKYGTKKENSGWIRNQDLYLYQPEKFVKERFTTVNNIHFK